MLSMVPGHAQQLPIHFIDTTDEKQKILYEEIVSLSKTLHLLYMHLHEVLSSFKSLTRHYGFNNFKPLRSYIQSSKLIQTEGYGIDLLKTCPIVEKKSKIKLLQIDVRRVDLELFILGKEDNEENYENVYRISFTDKTLSSFFELAIFQYFEENRRKKYWTKTKVEEILDEIMIPRSVENIEKDMKKISEMMQHLENSLLENISKDLRHLQNANLELTFLREIIVDKLLELNKLIYDLYQIPEDLVSYVNTNI
ncbi:MAG: hypothetical protein H7646_18520 [Candidatus Heimdallarchaeota archaeon]|nr:hypothetical protein [Candidatus Heimdallarchaeota archaeon]